MNKLSVVLLSIAVTACDVGSGAGLGVDDRSCSIDNQKDWVTNNMEDYYLFYDQLPTVNPDAYEGPEDYIEALRVAPFDRFSYVTDAAANTALFEEGKRFGFGMRIIADDQRRLFFSLVEPLSPLGKTDVKRGDELLAINGVTPDGFTREFIDRAFGVGNEEVTTTFTVLSSSDLSTQDVTVTKTNYSVQTVLDTKIIEHNNRRVAYLHFLTFLGTSEAELNTAFQNLANQNVDEMVLDLRLNSGGRISIAEQLASKIAGAAVEGAAFSRLLFNDKYSNENVIFPFERRTDSLDLPRLYVLSTPDTCSASEMVINGLRPFIEVVTLGSTSCGKPYGTASREFCGKSMNALEVSFTNNLSVGDYYDGIPADCPVDEDITQPLGDVSENLLRAALYHMDNNTCPSPTAIAASIATGQPTVLADVARARPLAAPKKAIKPMYDREDANLMNPSLDEIRTLLRH